MVAYSPAAWIFLFVIIGLIFSLGVVLCYIGLVYDDLQEALEDDQNSYYHPNKQSNMYNRNKENRFSYDNY